jgi:hypothetical protein
MKCLVTFGMLMAAAIQWVGASGPFRVAVMHTDQKTLDGIVHGNEFDLVVDRLGWEKEAFSYSQFAELAGRLGEFDMIAGAPLFFGDGRAFVEHAEKIRIFVNDGGAVVIPEANYPAATAWLEKVDSKLKAYGNGRDSRQWPKQKPILSTPRHPLYYLPNSKLPNEEVTAWGDLELDESLGWEVSLRTGNGKPSTAMTRFGKGIVYVSNQRQGNAATFENIRANLELQRLGLVATNFTLPGLGFDENVRPTFIVGSGEAEISLKAVSGLTGPVALEMEIIPEAGEVLKFRTHGNISDALDLTLPYRVSVRGSARLLVQIRTREGVGVLVDRQVVFPQLITVLPPRYRGLLSHQRRTETVDFRVKIARDQEALSGAKLLLKILSESGSQEAPSVEVKPTAIDFAVPVNLGDLPPGGYVVKAELRNASGMIGSSEAPFKVLEKVANQVVVDDDLTLLVEGEPFFPIGIFHMDHKELATIADLGFNTIQGWEWGFDHAQEVLNAAQQNKIKVILEMGNIRRRSHEIPQLIKRFSDHPALLAWYVFDEPQEPDFLFCEKVREQFRSGDPNHPTFMLSFLPHLFHQHESLGDIFSVDPYPLPNPMLTQVTDWTKRACDATRGNRPVWLVNQSFGGETAEQLRAMAFLSIVKGARGILWYPWDDGVEQKKGLNYYPELHGPMRELTAEIKELAPLLLGKHRREFSSEDGKIHGLFLADSTGRHLIAVNETPETASVTIDVPGESNGGSMKDATGANGPKITGGKVKFDLGPYGIARYRW